MLFRVPGGRSCESLTRAPARSYGAPVAFRVPARRARLVGCGNRLRATRIYTYRSLISTPPNIFSCDSSVSRQRPTYAGPATMPRAWQAAPARVEVRARLCGDAWLKRARRKLPAFCGAPVVRLAGVLNEVARPRSAARWKHSGGNRIGPPKPLGEWLGSYCRGGGALVHLPEREGVTRNPQPNNEALAFSLKEKKKSSSHLKCFSHLKGK